MKFPNWTIRIYSNIYSLTQRLLHHFNLHYMKPCYPDGDKMIWCHWCGARYVVSRAVKGESGLQDDKRLARSPKR